MGQRGVELCEKKRVLCTPHMNSCFCVNWTHVSDASFVEGEVRTVYSGAGKEGAVFGGL
jgi:hypothetical protein